MVDPFIADREHDAESARRLLALFAGHVKIHEATKAADSVSGAAMGRVGGGALMDRIGGRDLRLNRRMHRGVIGRTYQPIHPNDWTISKRDYRLKLMFRSAPVEAVRVGSQNLVWYLIYLNADGWMPAGVNVRQSVLRESKYHE